MSDKVRASAKLTLDTLEEVISTIPDMAEVFCVITRMKRAHPETALLEVIGPVFCNTTRHFLLIQVTHFIDVIFGSSRSSGSDIAMHCSLNSSFSKALSLHFSGLTRSCR